MSERLHPNETWQIALANSARHVGSPNGGSLGRITDVAFRSIRTLFEFVEGSKDAPADIQRTRSDTAALEKCLGSLETLNVAGDDVQGMFHRVGVADAVNSCGTACEALNKDLERWTKRGPEHLLSKLQVACNKSAITKGNAAIQTAKGTMTVAINTATIVMLAKDKSSSASQSDDRIRKLAAEVAQILEQAVQERRAAEGALQTYQQSISDPDDPSLEETVAMSNLEKTEETYGTFWANCAVAAKQIRQSESLIQTIGHVLSGEGSEVFVGMPESVVEKVRRQEIGDVRSHRNAKVKVGIFYQ